MSDSKIMSDSHWLGRIRDLMQQVGMPDSQSLYLAFTQLMFEMQRAALAAAPRVAQEPVAWMEFDKEGNKLGATWEPDGTWPTRPLIYADEAPRAALPEDARDAARYHWLREHAVVMWAAWESGRYDAETMDAEIDAMLRRT